MTEMWEGFEQYLKSKQPQSWHREEVARYRSRLHQILDGEFGLLQFFQSGSFAHGTAVWPWSDVDYVARIPFDQQPGSSSTILTKVKDLLARELWETTDVTVARPTVTVNFSGLIARYEIVPAFLLRGSTDSTTVLQIPGPNGTWIESAPRAHLAFVRDADQEHHGRVKELARLLKAWKYQHSVPISSFYLEMRAAAYGNAKDTILHLTGMRDVIKSLVSSGLPAMNDPARLVNRITPCSSEAARSLAVSALRTAAGNLDAAHAAWLRDDSWDLTQALRAVLGSGFPYVRA